MSWYLDNPNPAPNDDANPQQPSGPSVTRSHLWSLGVPMSDSDGLWSAHLETGGLQPQQQSGVNDCICHPIVFNTPLEDVHTGNVQSLFRVSDQPALPGSDILENLEEYSAQASHGRVELFDPSTCFECFVAFQNDSKLSKHGKDEGHRPYACLCGKTFSRLYTLTRHLSSRSAASVTSSVGAKHPCPLCTKYDGEKAFNRRDHLLQHLRVLHKIEDKGVSFVNGRADRMALAPAEAVNNAVGAVPQGIPMPHY
ncbi:hypothetical protein F4782DRAFT_535319 [Xylaria castorea]|nr:hypothetical protein F4782DRAFT_535319 [Xylaria castorea]